MSKSDKDIETAYILKILAEAGVDPRPAVEEIIGGRTSSSRVDRVVKRITDRLERLKKPFAAAEARKAAKPAKPAKEAPPA